MQNSRSTYSFSPKVIKKLAALAAKNDTSRTEILRRAITLYEYLEEERGDGPIKITKANGERVDLIMT